MIVKLLTEHHLEFLSLKGGCRGSSESTLVKMPHCWKSHALAHIVDMQRAGVVLFSRLKFAKHLKRKLVTLLSMSIVLRE